jgi:hypothetical protein
MTFACCENPARRYRLAAPAKIFFALSSICGTAVTHIHGRTAMARAIKIGRSLACVRLGSKSEIVGFRHMSALPQKLDITEAAN